MGTGTSGGEHVKYKVIVTVKWQYIEQFLSAYWKYTYVTDIQSREQKKAKSQKSLVSLIIESKANNSVEGDPAANHGEER